MKNLSASIRAKLLNMAKERKIAFQRILTLYKQEGLLHRIVKTSHGNEIVLKGGLLFYQLQGFIARPTKDIDLMANKITDSETILTEILTEVCSVSIEDALSFDPSSIQVKPITAQTAQGGGTGTITGYLGNAKTRLHIDIGFGDVITGGPLNRPYRTLLENRSFSIRTYSNQTIAAEKLDALIALGTVNSRYKDLYDLYELLIKFNLEESKVIPAACNTFKNRKTTLPVFPESLSERHWSSPSLESAWINYLKRIDAIGPDFIQLRQKLLPALKRIYVAAREEVNK